MGGSDRYLRVRLCKIDDELNVEGGGGWWREASRMLLDFWLLLYFAIAFCLSLIPLWFIWQADLKWVHTFPPLLSSLYAVSHLSHEILLKSQENSNTGCVRWQRRGENNYRIKDGHFIQLGFFGLFPEDTFFFFLPLPLVWSTVWIPFSRWVCCSQWQTSASWGNKQVILCFVDGREDLTFIQQLIKHWLFPF